MNRFSYNLAVSGSFAPSDDNAVNRIQENFNNHYIGENQKIPVKSSILPLPNRTHQKSSSNASRSSSIFDQFTDFEEEGIVSIVDENLLWLYPGENLVLRELNVGYHKQDSPERIVVGRVYITNYRLKFEERQRSDKIQLKPIHFEVTLGSISKIEKMGYYNVRRSATGTTPPYGININCKDIRNIRFINRRESHGRRALYDCLRKYAFPNTNRLPFFANLYHEKFHHDGWALFDMVREFQRQNVPNNWRISHINERYEFAGTYPALFFVPSEVYRQRSPEEFLHSVSEFRSKKRIPVLSWIDSRTTASLVRSSQPMVGALSRKSVSDEDYIEMIISANSNSKYLVILDARPSINAKANRANGGGYENYPLCQLQFMDIQNIHVVRESLKKLKDACFPRIRQKYFQRTLVETKWLAHLQTILEAAALAAREISVQRNSVLVHCSDGWDRTAQIVSLAMLQLDPYYRTIEGFAVLIEKEWCSFGHKFAQRVGHGQDKPDDKERSPIFVQFIDCVWQLYNQFTSSFQFNVRFLKMILDELYSCRFGNFLYNCERERTELQVKQSTVSLWSFVLDNRVHFLNEKYNSNDNLDDFVQQRTKVHPLFWTDYYCRYSQLVPSDADDNISQLGSVGPSTPMSANFPYTPFQHGRKESDNNDYVNTTTGGSNSKNSNFPRTTLAQQLPPEVPPRQRGLMSPKRTSTPQNKSDQQQPLDRLKSSSEKQNFQQPCPNISSPNLLSPSTSNRSSSVASAGHQVITHV